MSILIDESSHILVQGLKGQRSMLALESSLKYGTNVVAGVVFGRGGETVLNIPIYNTVSTAVKNHRIDATVIFTKGSKVKFEVIEACQAEIPLIVVMEEEISWHERAEMMEWARRKGCKIIGPNSNGIISVGKSKIGTIGGMHPNQIFIPGSVGIISRSVGLASEIGYLLKQHQIGVTTCVTMGSDKIVGYRMKELVQLFLEDEETETIVLCGFDGSLEEDHTAEYLASHRSGKPVIAYLCGRFLDEGLRERFFSKTFIGESFITEKRRLLKAAGVKIVEHFQDIPGICQAYAN